MNSHQLIIITGGHLTPALATIEEIRSRHTEWDISFFGRKKALENDVSFSEEYRIIQSLGIPFFSIHAGRLTRTISIASLLALGRFPVGIAESLYFLGQVRPSVIVSFGGYIGLSVTIAAYILQIPVIIHEQTMVPGLSNRLGSRFATRVCVSFSQTKRYFPEQKTDVIGLPVRRQVFSPPPMSTLEVDSSVPLLYITGGTTGARSLNELIYPNIESLAKYYSIVHQVGAQSIHVAQKLKQGLSEKSQIRYTPVRYLDTQDHAWVMNNAKLIISRSGANSVAEIALLGKIAILIPLPWSAGREQQKNAELLVNAGSAISLDQKTLTAEELLATVDHVKEKYSTMIIAAKRTMSLLPKDSAAKLIQIIESVHLN